MVAWCCAYNCTNRASKGSGVSFFGFPLNEKERLNQWIAAIKRKDFVPSRYSVICSEHFTPECFLKNYVNIKKLKSDAVPTIFDFPDHLKKERLPRKAPSDRSYNSSGTPTATTSATLDANSCMNTNFDHAYCIKHSPRKMKRQYEELLDAKEKKISSLTKKLKSSKVKCSRRQKKITSLKDLLHVLKDEKVINDKCIALLEENFDGVSLEIFKRQFSPSGTYSEKLKSFALSLHFHSPSAYKYVRETLNMCLPHPQTLRRWCSSVEGKPGFTSEALVAIKHRIQTANYDVYCALIFDEMSIRKRIDWDGNQFVGFVDLGNGVCHDYTAEAKEALVFMVVGVNVSWAIPIGYFLIDGLNTCEKATLVEEAICLIEDNGGKVMSLTFDGTSTNLSMAENLGAHLNVKNMKSYFENPADPLRKIYVIPDPCHMIKLMRNLFAQKPALIDFEGKFIKWSYIMKLGELQERDGLHLANRVTKHHIQWYQQKLKVSLAVQVLSSSVSQSLIYLEKDLKLVDFKGAEPTANFCSVFDRLFDVCNSKNPFAKGYKAVLRKSNESLWKPFLNEASAYLHGLKDASNNKFLHETQKKTSIIGFICLCESMKGLFSDLVDSGKLSYLPMYKTSQDHVEMFFCRIRHRGGWNNNPSAAQFRVAYRRLLIHNEIKSKGTANCIAQDDTELLSWSAAYKSTSEQNATVWPSCTTTCRLYDSSFNQEECNVTQVEECIFSSIELSEYSSNVVVYVAGFVARKLMKKVVKCPDCVLALTTEGDVPCDDFLKRRNLGGLVTPTEDVLKICRIAERCLRAIVIEGKPPSGKIKTALTSSVMNELISTNIFQCLHEHSLENEYPDNHIISLVKAISNEYLNVRLHHIGKLHNSKIKAQNVRQKLNKIILFSNQ